MILPLAGHDVIKNAKVRHGPRGITLTQRKCFLSFLAELLQVAFPIRFQRNVVNWFDDSFFVESVFLKAVKIIILI